ncbi:hypothetical protein AB0L04_33110 [Streptomyces glaucescens]|uniref:hypothetical protein n=1 Tax=Streptomyces glaucescens TaxID=1907 RepID=UPI00344BD4FC
MEYEEDGLGSGRVCLDDEGRANGEFTQVPNKVIAQALDEIRSPTSTMPTTS